MVASDAGQGVDVNVGTCRCPGGSPIPHPDGDTVTLASRLSVPMGAAASAALNDALPTLGGMQAALTGVYLAPAPSGGITRWSFLDAEGKPEPISAETVERLIPWSNGGMEVAEEADRLYAPELMAPFLRRLAKLSAPGPTDTSTSASPPSGPSSPTPSVPSSPNARAGKRSAAPAP